MLHRKGSNRDKIWSEGKKPEIKNPRGAVVVVVIEGMLGKGRNREE